MIRLDATRIGGEQTRSSAARRIPCKRKEGTNTITNIDELTQNEAVAYFKADLCLSDPDNYSLEEKREICDEMAATSKAIEAAIKADFEALPPEAQDKLLDMLCASGCMTPEWWKSTLFGEMPNSVEEIERTTTE